MRRSVLALIVSCLPIASLAQTQEWDRAMQPGCYEWAAMNDMAGLSDDDAMMKMFDLITDGRCDPAIYMKTDWDAGAVIGSVRAVYAYPYPRYTIDGMFQAFNAGIRPVAEVMYFNNDIE